MAWTTKNGARGRGKAGVHSIPECHESLSLLSPLNFMRPSGPGSGGQTYASSMVDPKPTDPRCCYEIAYERIPKFKWKILVF